MKLKLEITQDGNQISVLAGTNLQEGIAGFGDDIPSALKNFADRWRMEFGVETTITDPIKMKKHNNIFNGGCSHKWTGVGLDGRPFMCAKCGIGRPTELNLA